MQKMMWFACGLLAGLTVLSISKASVPTKNQVTDDTALYQRLSEIHVQKQAKIDFDSDINQLSRLESRYQEKLPYFAGNSRLRSPMKRIAQQKYSYSGNSRS